MTVGGGCPYSEQALRRAIIDRINYNTPKAAIPLSLMRSTLEFEHTKHRAAAAAYKPCPASVVWWAGDNGSCTL